MASRRDIKESEDADEDGEREDEDGGEELDDARDEGEEGRRKRARASKSAGRTTWQRLKAWFRDTRLYLYAAFFVGSVVLAMLGVMSIWLPRALGAGLEAWFASIGSWDTYLFIGGILALLTSGYLFLALLAKRREFKHLVSTRSKGDFVHSLDRIERLAFELGTHENEVVAARKREFKIRH